MVDAAIALDEQGHQHERLDDHDVGHGFVQKARMPGRQLQLLFVIVARALALELDDEQIQRHAHKGDDGKRPVQADQHGKGDDELNDLHDDGRHRAHGEAGHRARIAGHALHQVARLVLRQRQPVAVQNGRIDFALDAQAQVHGQAQGEKVHKDGIDIAENFIYDIHQDHPEYPVRQHVHDDGDFLPEADVAKRLRGLLYPGKNLLKGRGDVIDDVAVYQGIGDADQHEEDAYARQHADAAPIALAEAVHPFELAPDSLPVNILNGLALEADQPVHNLLQSLFPPFIFCPAGV